MKVSSFAGFRLHFRPKTPPPDYQPPCHLLPADDPTFIPSANTPFSLELEVLDEAPSTVLDASSFVTAPFTLEDLGLEVPITDTRQSSDKNVQTGVSASAGPNTLNSSVSNVDLDDDDGGDETRTICCSKFRVLDKCASSKKHSSTLTSPKLNNSVNVSPEGRQQQRQMNDTSLNNNANGLLSQFGLDGEFRLCCRCFSRDTFLQGLQVAKRKIIKFLTLTLVG